MAVRTYLPTFYAAIKRIIAEEILCTGLFTEIHSTEVLSGMVDDTAQHCEFTVEAEQCCVAPVGKETAVLKHRTHTALAVNKRILAVVEEVAMRAVYCLRVA